MTAAGRFAAFMLGVLLLASACVGGSGSGDSTATTPPQSPGAAVAVPTAVEQPTPAPPEEGGGDVLSKGLAWIIGLGAGSASGPQQIGVYENIQQATEDSCRAAFQSQDVTDEEATLFHGAAAACLAAFHGKTQRWEDAEHALDSLGVRPDGCIDQAVYDVLGSAVQAHRADPTAAFKLAKGQKIALPCPTINALSVTTDAENGITIVVSGDNLGQVKEVTFVPVGACPHEVEIGALTTDTMTVDGKTITATVAGSDESPPAFLWVGLAALPEPWVAASDCAPVPISEPDGTQSEST